jgi:FixJ family two-component response regulator
MKPVIHIVDDDEAMRDSLTWLLDSERFTIQTYVSAEAFLTRALPRPRGSQSMNQSGSQASSHPACLILDIRMPGMSGVELHEQLMRQGIVTPVIFVTGHGDVPMAVEAIKRGAFDFVEKPFDETKLLGIIERAIAQDALHSSSAEQQSQLAARLTRLSPREREVLDLVVSGKMNKTIADTLGISIKTVEAHRARVMEKMDARSLAELVQQVMQAREPV